MTNEPTKTEVARAAAELCSAGMSVVRVRGDGTKRPDGHWEECTHRARTPKELAPLFPPGADPAPYGVGVVCGPVSGGLLMLEFEGAAIEEGWLERAELAVLATGDPAVIEAWSALMSGWVERSPSGGVHLHVRVDPPEACPGNVKIASRPLREDELTDVQRAAVARRPELTYPKTMVETRGAGGFAVRAPSGGPVHPSGESYLRVQGSPDFVPVVPSDALDALLTALKALNEYEPPTAAERRSTGRTELQTASSPFEDGVSPMDDFNERGEWLELLDGILVPTETRRDGVELWTRLGKDPRDGHSATIGHAGKDLLYVFSSSVAELPQGLAMSKAKVFTWLTQGSFDGTAFSDAAKELYALGYGTRRAKRGGLFDSTSFAANVVLGMENSGRIAEAVRSFRGLDPLAVQARYERLAAELSDVPGSEAALRRAAARAMGALA